MGKEDNEVEWKHVSFAQFNLGLLRLVFLLMSFINKIWEGFYPGAWRDKISFSSHLTDRDGPFLLLRAFINKIKVRFRFSLTFEVNIQSEQGGESRDPT